MVLKCKSPYSKKLFLIILILKLTIKLFKKIKFSKLKFIVLNKIAYFLIPIYFIFSK